PHTAAAGIGNAVVQIRTRCDVAHAQRVEFRSLVVATPQQAFVVAGMVDAADPEIGLALGFLVPVEKHFLRAALARRTEIARLFAALAERGPVGVRPVT